MTSTNLELARLDTALAVERAKVASLRTIFEDVSACDNCPSCRGAARAALVLIGDAPDKRGETA